MSSHTMILAGLLVASAPSLAAQQPSPAPVLTATAAGLEVRARRMPLETGVELQVLEAGPADGTPVLFLHGYGDSWFSFSPMLDRLPPGVRAIVPTQRGHGDSERPECCYTFTDFAADASALLDALDIERAAVVGHSMGSFVAQRLAIDDPERVTRLVLIGSGDRIRVPPVEELAADVATLTDPIPSAWVRDFQSGTVHEPLPPAFLEGVVGESSKLPARIWQDAMKGMLAGDASEELHRIQAPTLVMWGEQDGLFDRNAQDALVEAIPNATLVTYPDLAHSPNWEDPDEVAQDLWEFLGVGATSDATPAERVPSGAGGVSAASAPSGR